MALVVAANIVWTGVRIVRRSISGLVDVSLSAGEVSSIHKTLKAFQQERVRVHSLQTRRSWATSFVTLNVLVPGQWTVQQGHKLLDRLEADIRRVQRDAIVSTHLEPLGDPASMRDA